MTHQGFHSCVSTPLSSMPFLFKPCQGSFEGPEGSYRRERVWPPTLQHSIVSSLTCPPLWHTHITHKIKHTRCEKQWTPRLLSSLREAYSLGISTVHSWVQIALFSIMCPTPGSHGVKGREDLREKDLNSRNELEWLPEVRPSSSSRSKLRVISREATFYPASSVGTFQLTLACCKRVVKQDITLHTQSCRLLKPTAHQMMAIGCVGVGVLLQVPMKRSNMNQEVQFK